jgi:hypothetical protein
MFRADSSRVHGLAVLFVAVAFALAPAAARADKARSKQEEQRRKLLEEMGLKKNDAPPVPAAVPVMPEPEAPEEKDKDEKTDGKGSARAGTPSPPAGPSFRRAIHPLLVQSCKACHAPGAAAQATTLLLSGDPAADHPAVRRLVDVRAPAASAILAKASGQKLHGGGAPWPVGGPAYARVLAWVQAGARLDGGARPAASAAVATPAPAPSPAAKPARGKPEPGKPETQVAEAPVAAPTVSETAAPEAPADDRSAPPAPPPDEFSGVVHPLLVRTCGGCHGPVGQAAATRLVLSGEPGADYQKIRPLVDPASPAASPLLVKGRGEMHAGGPVLKSGSAEYGLVADWVAKGAAERAAPPAGAKTAPPATAPAAPVVVVPSAPVPAAMPATPPSPHHPGPGGVGLPFGLMLNGRFDLAYERGNFTGSPFDDGATNALRSYHHFLFLSRESAEDPVGLSLEILSLQFWEVHLRWRSERWPVQVLVSGGKIFVPFGADPLMHQSYGGLAGFDQKILPVIWAQEGGAVHVTVHHRALAITDDLYAVHGYALRTADGVLNLQNDFSPADNVKLGWGNRLGAAFGPLSAWYSLYYNPLGFGRRLFMQAGDVMLWRMRGIPVLGHFSAAAGVLRADVSGGDDQGVGGPGKDYYDFGSYFQVRFHPTDWMYLQYRQGLRTFNNRRGVIVDETRLTSDDASAHNFGVVARWRGITGGLYYFINLEKGPEIPNDFFRLSVTYDF